MRTANRTAQEERLSPAAGMPLLQAIRKRFTSGRPRKIPAEILGPMTAVLLANNERDKIAEFITEQNGKPSDFLIQVAVVTVTLGAPDAEAGRVRWLPTTLDEIIALADKLKKIEGLLFAGLLVVIQDRKNGAICRYMRSFVASPEANEILARAALSLRFQDRRVNA